MPNDEKVIKKILKGREAVKEFEKTYADTKIVYDRPEKEARKNHLEKLDKAKKKLLKELKSLGFDSMTEFEAVEQRASAISYAESYTILTPCDCCRSADGTKKPTCKWVDPTEPRTPLIPIRDIKGVACEEEIGEIIWLMTKMTCGQPAGWNKKVPYHYRNYEKGTPAGAIIQQVPDCSVYVKYHKTPELPWRW